MTAYSSVDEFHDPDGRLAELAGGDRLDGVDGSLDLDLDGGGGCE
jgi:hypothetical protein